MQEVVIPASVTSIGEAVFSNCSKLKKVSIPESVKVIGPRAFGNCYMLSTVDIPINGLVSIGEKAFTGCNSLFKFSVPVTTIEIGDSAFSDCKNLNSVIMDKNLHKNLNSSVFSGCPSSLNITDYNYASLNEMFRVGDFTYAVTYPAVYGKGCVTLYGVEEQTETVTVPAVVEILGQNYKVTDITSESFMDNLTVKKVVLGSNILYIGNSAFKGCTNLVSVTGGGRLKTIGDKAFCNCPNLKVFKISSAALWKIGPFAFSGDKNLKTLYFKGTKSLTKSGVKNSLKGSSVKTVKVKKSKVKKYKKIFKKKNCGKKVKVKK